MDAQRSTWRRLVAPANLVVLGAAMAGGAVLHSVAIVALGGVAYGALVAWDVLQPNERAPAVPPLVALPDGLADARAAEIVDRLTAAHRGLERVVAETPESVTSYLATAFSTVQELEKHAATLLGRTEELARFLATQDRGAIAADVDRLRAEAKRTRDEHARREYEQARTAREGQLQTLDELDGARDRALAHLARIVATVEALSARVARMRALDRAALDGAGREVAQELGTLDREVGVFEETLETLAEEALS